MQSEAKATNSVPFALRGLIAVVGFLPLPVVHAFGTVLGTLTWLLPTRHRRVATRNVAMCFPELAAGQRAVMVWRVLVESGKGLLELPLFWRRKPANALRLIREVRGLELFESKVGKGKPVLFAAPHLGAWELLNLYLSSRTPISVLYREAKINSVDLLLLHGRQRFGGKAIPATAAGLRELLKAARAGDLIGILPDQQPKRGEGVFAPFFGHEALTMVLFSRLAAKLDCEMLIGFAERLSWGRGFRIRFLPADAEIADSDPVVAASALNRSVEACVLAAPTQYQWTYKRFSIRPDGSRLDY